MKKFREMTDPLESTRVAELLKLSHVGFIAKDQQLLLDQESAWITPLSREPTEISSSVPDHVRQTVTEAHTGMMTALVQPNMSSQALLPNSQPPSPSQSVISWEVTPPRSRAASSRKSPPPIQTSKSPIDRTRAGRTPIRTQQNAVPMSTASEEELEIIEPQAYYPLKGRNADKTPGQHYSTMIAYDPPTQETPPCAQVSSGDSPQILAKAPPSDHRPHKRMKPVHITSPIQEISKDAAKTVNANTAIARMPATKPVQEVDDSTQETQSSVSVVPQTLPESQSLFASSASPLRDDSRRSINHSSANSYVQPTPRVNGLAVEKRTLDIGLNIELYSQDPLEAFHERYPDYMSSYSGSRSKFVKACICLDHLRKQNSLRDCLYDDFIRTFSHGYIKYISRIRKDPKSQEEELPAVEWFNKIDGPPVFSDMVVTKCNLDYILRIYQDDVTRLTSFVIDAGEEEEAKPKEFSKIAKPSSTVDLLSTRYVPATPLPTAPLRSVSGPEGTAPQSPELGAPSTARARSGPFKRPETKPPPSSQSARKLVSSTPASTPGRSAKERLRLREHFNKQKLSGSVSGKRSTSTRPSF